MCAEGKSAHTVFTEAFRRKKQYECFKIRGILCAMFLSAQINAAGFIRRKAEKFFYIFCSLRRTRLPCGEGADFSETAQAHCCPCAAFQGLKKHHVQFCLFSVVDRLLSLKRIRIYQSLIHSECEHLCPMLYWDNLWYKYQAQIL